MNIPRRIILAAMLLLLFSGNGLADEKAKLGPCVRECVQAYNPSLADSGADEFMAEDFRARECVQMCKGTIYEGECNSWTDGCCHADYIDVDPDCQSEPPGLEILIQAAILHLDRTRESTLPPDPGEAGMRTLAGIDSDQDGIRDDIQRYIALTYPDSSKTRAALRQAAIALHKAILESPDEESALRNTELEARASECLWYVHSESSIKMSDILMAEFLNTIARSRAYLEYDSKLSGHVFGGRDIDEYRSSCTFDPDQMED